jgi:hypothetical protein
VESIVMPMWVIHVFLGISVACILAGPVLLAIGLFGYAGHPDAMWGCFGGAFGCMVGGLGSFLGTYNSMQMMKGAVHVFYRLRLTRVDIGIAVYGVVGLALLVIGLVFLAAGADRAHVHGSLLLGAITLLQVGAYGIFRWVILRNARALFTLYLDGALTPEETEAIDRARDGTPAFDRMIREFDGVNRAVRDWAGS